MGPLGIGKEHGWAFTTILAEDAGSVMLRVAPTRPHFPVDKASCSYPVLWNAFKRMTAGCSAAEKAALFHDTAMRVCRL